MRWIYQAGGSDTEGGTHRDHLVWRERERLGGEGGYIYGNGPGGSEMDC